MRRALLGTVITVFALGASSAALGQERMSLSSSSLNNSSVSLTAVSIDTGTVRPIDPGGPTVTPYTPDIRPCVSATPIRNTNVSLTAVSIDAISAVSFTAVSFSRCSPGPGPIDQGAEGFWEDAFGGSFTLPLTARLDLQIGGEIMLRTDTDQNEMLDLTGNTVEIGTIYEFAPGVHGGISYRYESHETDKHLDENQGMFSLSLSARF